MEYPSYKETSEMLDEWRLENNQPKMWGVKKLLIHMSICFALAFMVVLIDEAKKKVEFKRKYKTVVKENWIGIKSYEYHERD